MVYEGLSDEISKKFASQTDDRQTDGQNRLLNPASRMHTRVIKFCEMTHKIQLVMFPTLKLPKTYIRGRSSLVPRPPRPAFDACNKSWAWRPENEARQEYMMLSSLLCRNEDAIDMWSCTGFKYKRAQISPCIGVIYLHDLTVHVEHSFIPRPSHHSICHLQY